MAETIQLEDIGEKITITNQYGKALGDIFVRVDDYNILERAKKAEKEIQKHIEETERLTNEMQREDQEELIRIISKIDAKIKGEIDYLFDSPVSEVVFGNTHCLSTKNGKYFVENFLDAIMPAVNRIVTKEAELSQKRMSKYLQEYQTSDYLKKGGEHR